MDNIHTILYNTGRDNTFILQYLVVRLAKGCDDYRRVGPDLALEGDETTEQKIGLDPSFTFTFTFTFPCTLSFKLMHLVDFVLIDFIL